MNIRRIIAGLAVTPLVAAFALPLTAFAATTTVVTPSNTQGWTSVLPGADTRPGGEVNFVADASAPGDGALQLKTDATTAAKAQYMHAADSVPIGDVTNLSYAAKQVTASFPEGQASYQLPVLLNGTSGFTTLVYEPYNQDPAGDVTPGAWQTWDVDAGRMWSSRTVTCGTNTVSAGGGGAPFYTLAQIETMCPEAVVIGFGVNVGTFNPSYNVHVDSVVFNDTTYNFELDQASGEITSPAAGAHVRGVVTLSATYDDGDTVNDDAVQWALREGTCNASTGTVAGNVDGENSPYTWDGASFNAQVDTSTLTPGEYCFVFNPADDPGQGNVRETRTFFVDANAPYNKDECKQDGWKQFTAPKFKNQGDCVSFMASNGKAKGNPTPATVVMANNPQF